MRAAGDDAQVNAFMCKLFQIENSHLLYTMTPLPWSFFLLVFVFLSSFLFVQFLFEKYFLIASALVHTLPLTHTDSRPRINLNEIFLFFFFRRRRRTSENPNIGKLVCITYCVRLGNLAFD